MVVDGFVHKLVDVRVGGLFRSRRSLGSSLAKLLNSLGERSTVDGRPTDLDPNGIEHEALRCVRGESAGPRGATEASAPHYGTGRVRGVRRGEEGRPHRSARLAAQFVGPTVLTCCMARAVRSEAAAASSSWVSRCVLSFNRVFASRRMVAYQSSSTQTTRRVSTGRGTSTTPLLLYAPAKQPRYNHHHTTQPPPYPRAINGHWHNDDQYRHDHGQANHPICTL